MNLIYILKLILSNNHIQLIKALKNNDYKYAEYILSLKSLPIVPTIILINEDVSISMVPPIRYNS